MDDRLERLRAKTEAAVLRGPGATPPELRQAVARGEPPEELRALVDAIRRHAYRVTDEQFAALAGRYDHDQLFEIVVAAALGAAGERLRAGLKALDEATAEAPALSEAK
jgi:hypothetical protein